MTRKMLKEAAKENMAYGFKDALISIIIAWLGGAAISFVFDFLKVEILSAPVIALFVTGPFLVGIAGVYLNIAKHGDGTWVAVFDGFKIFWRSFVLYILKYIFITLWSLLFVIPGIIAAFRYSMAEYILYENPDMSAMDAIRESKRLMDGKKADLFVLYLSFFGWYLLSAITCGIAYIWVAPYVTATVTNFYLDIKSEKNFNAAL